MSAKFHINPETGKSGNCTASVKPCKYGENTEHYSSPSEAAAAYEASMKKQTLASHSRTDLSDPRIDRAQATAASVYELSAKLHEDADDEKARDGASAQHMKQASQMIDEVIEKGNFTTGENAERMSEKLEDLQSELNRRANNTDDEAEATAWFRASEGLADKILSLQD